MKRNVNKIKETSKDVELMKIRRIKMLKNKCWKKHDKVFEKTDSYNKALFAVKSFATKLKKAGVQRVKFSKEEIEEIKQKAIAYLSK